MDTITRRSALAAGAAVVLSSCAGASDEAVPAAGDDAATIAAWVEQHRGDLPTEYDELGRLPFPYRHEICLRFSSMQKSALVQEHLRRSIAARPRLTDEQRAVIDLAREAMTPAWYEATPEERQRWGDRWGQRIGDAFDGGEFIRIFGSIGPEDDAIRQMIAEGATPAPREPSAYEEIEGRSREEQLAVWKAAAPSKRASILRGYLEHLAAHEGLAAEQRDALLESAALVSPDWYEPGATPATRGEVDRVIRAAFGPDAAGIMMSLD